MNVSVSMPVKLSDNKVIFASSASDHCLVFSEGRCCKHVTPFGWHAIPRLEQPASRLQLRQPSLHAKHAFQTHHNCGGVFHHDWLSWIVVSRPEAVLCKCGQPKLARQ